MGTRVKVLAAGLAIIVTPLVLLWQRVCRCICLPDVAVMKCLAQSFLYKNI
jgi:hypothetical protein